MPDSLLGVVAFVLTGTLSALAVGWVRSHALRRGLLDRPNERSSHQVAKPRGGGLGLVLTVLVMIPVVAPEARTLAALLSAAGVASVAAIGWMDDRGGVAVRLRLLVHVLAGCAVLPLTSGLPLPAVIVWLGPIWWVFWTVSAINVVNFVDGIDGIIGLQVLVFATFVAITADAGGLAQLSALVLGGASLGFLLWNWSPARIFMGDVGSGALGVLVVVVGALRLREPGADFIAVYSTLLPIFLDAAVTIVRRIRRREHLSVAHRSHLYQRIANGGAGHALVAGGYAATSVACGVAATLTSVSGITLLLLLLSGCAALWVLAERMFARAA